MVTLHEPVVVVPGAVRYVAYAKGAPEAVLPRCALDAGARREAAARAAAMAEAGLRVLAVARAELDAVPVDLAGGRGGDGARRVGRDDRPPAPGGRGCRRRVPHRRDRAGDDHR